MTSLRIGGVPEHFNLPWHRLIEGPAPERPGVDVSWRDYPEGSGAMAAALRAGELDAAMLLTEGAVAGAAAGGFKIVSLYTESPLIWGIHVPAVSSIRTVEDLRGRRYAISRRGSGSHLMSVVHARERGWPAADLDFVVVGTLQGAIDAFASGTADVFFWEKFMTKPLVDAGKFRRVAAIAERYGLRADDVHEWLRATRWASRPGVRAEHIAPAVAQLGALGLIGADVSAAALLAPLA